MRKRWGDLTNQSFIAWPCIGIVYCLLLFNKWVIKWHQHWYRWRNFEQMDYNTKTLLLTNHLLHDLALGPFIYFLFNKWQSTLVHVSMEHLRTDDQKVFLAVQWLRLEVLPLETFPSCPSQNSDVTSTNSAFSCEKLSRTQDVFMCYLKGPYFNLTLLTP